MDKNINIYGIKDTRCANCGKLIIPTPQWVYKIRRYKEKPKYYCSYKCYRRAGGDSGKCKKRGLYGKSD